MHAVKHAKRLTACTPHDAGARTIADLVIALASAQPYALGQLDTLDDECFALVLGLLMQWRNDRHLAGQFKLLDLALQSRALPPAPVLARPAPQFAG